MLVDDASDHHALIAGSNAERGGKFPLAFQHHNAALLDALYPLRHRSRSDVANHKQIRRPSGGAGDSDGREDLRPRAGIVARNVVIKRGGCNDAAQPIRTERSLARRMHTRFQLEDRKNWDGEGCPD